MKARALLLEVGLLVAMVAVFATLIVIPILGTPGLGLLQGSVSQAFGKTLQVQAELSIPVVEGLRPGTYGVGEGVELSGPTFATASIQGQPDLRQRTGLLGGRLLLGLTALAALGLLLQVVRTLRRGDPFVRANARRLRSVAVVVAFGGTASELLRGWGTIGLLSADTVRDRVVVGVEISFIPLVAGLVIGLLAEVFAQGADLRDDVDGLV